MSLLNFIQRGRASVIVGGQFGSEAKGLAAAIVARTDREYGRDNFPLICTTNAGAQAGHTTILEDGTKFVCYHLPTLGVMTTSCKIYLNAGSIIDPELLAREIIDVGTATGEGAESLRRRIVVHPRAAIINTRHKDIESGAYLGGLADGKTTQIGSTMKGVGAALTDKIMRNPLAIAKHSLDPQIVDQIRVHDLNYYLSHERAAVTVEIPQGTGLSLNASMFYPHCTSRDCWVGAGLTDAGINPHFLGQVLMVQRTYPIRVGHIYDDQGVMIGDSGPFYRDSREIGWEDLPGIEPERTTVTKRVRRIATWSAMQYREAIRLNHPSIVLTTFVNYMQSRQQCINMYAEMKVIHQQERLSVLTAWSYGPRVDQFCGSLDEAMRRGGGSE